MILVFIITITYKMIVLMTKDTISRFLEQEEMIEFTILPMHNKEFIIHIETPNKKNSTIITDNWEELVKEFY